MEEYFAYTAEQVGDHFIAAHAQCFGGGIQVQAMTSLILHFSKQDGFALERRSLGYPVSSGSMPTTSLCAC